MDCRDCPHYVGDYDETTDCYEQACPIISGEDEERRECIAESKYIQENFY